MAAQPIIETPDEQPDERYSPDHADTANTGPILIGNEFADVVLRRVATRNGMRLEIWSPRRGSRVLLDAVALDCLSYSEPRLITELLTANPGA